MNQIHLTFSPMFGNQDLCHSEHRKCGCCLHEEFCATKVKILKVVWSSRFANIWSTDCRHLGGLYPTVPLKTNCWTDSHKQQYYLVESFVAFSNSWDKRRAPNNTSLRDRWYFKLREWHEWEPRGTKPLAFCARKLLEPEGPWWELEGLTYPNWLATECNRHFFLMDCYEVFLWTPNSSHLLWKATNVMSKQTMVCIEYRKWSQGPFGFPAVFVHHPVQGILPPTCCKSDVHVQTTSSYLTACESLKWSQVNWATVCIEGASSKHITSISRIPAGLMDPGILQPWVAGADIFLHDITLGAWLIW